MSDLEVTSTLASGIDEWKSEVRFGSGTRPNMRVMWCPGVWFDTENTEIACEDDEEDEVLYLRDSRDSYPGLWRHLNPEAFDLLASLLRGVTSEGPR